MPTARKSTKPIDGIKSNPPSRKKKILNIWYDDVTGELVFDAED